MKYYRVPKLLDNHNIYKKGRYIGFLVGNELYTEKECKRLGLNTALLIPVEISRKKCFWMFGARFEIDQ